MVMMGVLIMMIIAMMMMMMMMIVKLTYLGFTSRIIRAKLFNIVINVPQLIVVVAEVVAVVMVPSLLVSM